MIVTKKQKLSVSFLIVLALFLFFIFSIKGKNSPKNKLLRAAERTISFVSTESQHDWLRFYDFTRGYDKDATKIGWVTDIHADRFKRRTVESGTLFPRNYSEYLPKVFDSLRRQGVVTVLATGDNVNSGDENYAEELAKLAYAKNMRVIWVKGNHDSDASMRKLGLNGENFYYYRDFEKTRLIVLDNTQQQDDGSWMTGGVGKAEMDWINEALKTDKKVVVAMHVPIFPVTQEAVVLPEYVELERILRNSENVKLVLSGHSHVKWDKRLDGLNFYGESALTRENEQGGYGIIDLNKMSVNYFYAN